MPKLRESLLNKLAHWTNTTCMNYQKVSLALLSVGLTLLLQGCLTLSKKPQPEANYKQGVSTLDVVGDFLLPRPSPVITKPVKFKVLTKVTSPDLTGEADVMVCMSVPDYENLSYNASQMLMYIRNSVHYMDASDALLKALKDEVNYGYGGK